MRRFLYFFAAMTVLVLAGAFAYRIYERELTELGLVVVREDIRGAFFGTVREQSLEPGTEVPKGTEIVLSVV